MEKISHLIWRKDEVPAELLPLLDTLSEEYPISDFGKGLKIRFRRIDGKETVSRVTRNRGEVLVEYTSVAAAARGIGSAFAKLDGEERTSFTTLGIMLDVSRNMVMTVDNLKMWFRRMALAGCNLVMLYTEDTYELPDEPFFGYMRGGYSQSELRELDAYAKTLGIELVGCIQTLGHMDQMLTWQGAYGKVRDTSSVLKADAPETYQLIEKMMKFWSETLSSRRIHIGMDETHDLGLGKFLDEHGYEKASSILLRHLGKVSEICKSHGLKPMMWSDMFFRTLNKAHRYYDTATPIPDAVKKSVPGNVDLVYWDYYHTEEEPYREMIARHREFNREPIVGSGIWTWTRLWYDHEKTAKTVVPCISACRKEKVKELFFTMWGDDGAYCNYNSSLAGILWCSDLAYGVSPVDLDRSAERFEVICGSDFRAHLAGGNLNCDSSVTPGVPDIAASSLIWDDPLMGVAFDNYLRQDPEFDLKLIDRYEELQLQILPLVDDCEAGDFEHLSNTLDLLIRKLQLRGALLAAYAHDDRVALRQIATKLIPSVLTALEEFDASFRRQWLECAKPFGLDVIQLRNGGQKARLEELEIRLREYLDGEISEIAELDARIATGVDIVNASHIYNLYAKSSHSAVFN